MVTIAFHKDITPEKWASKPLSWQILNIASELGRAEQSLKDRLLEPFRACLDRGFELIDLTVEVNISNASLLRELLRFREVLACLYINNDLQSNAGDLRVLTKVLLSLDPEAYNLLGVTY